MLLAKGYIRIVFPLRDVGFSNKVGKKIVVVRLFS